MQEETGEQNAWCACWPAFQSSAPPPPDPPHTDRNLTETKHNEATELRMFMPIHTSNSSFQREILHILLHCINYHSGAGITCEMWFYSADVSPSAARNSWQPGSLQSCTLIDTWMGASEKSWSLSLDCSCTSTWWSFGEEKHTQITMEQPRCVKSSTFWITRTGEIQAGRASMQHPRHKDRSSPIGLTL